MHRLLLQEAFLGIVAVLGEMERALLIERVRSGMARARAEGRQIGRARLDVNREQVIQDRRSGMSLTQVARKHGISRASVCRLMKGVQCNTAVSAFAGSMPEQASAASGTQWSRVRSNSWARPFLLSVACVGV